MLESFSSYNEPILFHLDFSVTVLILGITQANYSRL